MSFDPAKINLQQSQCEHNGRKSVCVKTEVCFAYRIKSDQKYLNFTAGEPVGIPCWLSPSFKVVVFSYFVFSCLLPPAEIQYNLKLDALRAKARALFINQHNKSDSWITRRLTIKDRESQCVNETFMMLASSLIFFQVHIGYLFLICKKMFDWHSLNLSSNLIGDVNSVLSPKGDRTELWDICREGRFRS